MAMLPEITLLVLAFVILLTDLFLPLATMRNWAPLGAMLGLAVSLVLLFALPTESSLFGGRFVMDEVTWWFKLVFLVSGFLVVGFSADLMSGKHIRKDQLLESPSEFLVVLLFTLTGMLYLVSSRDMVTMYVSLELATIPLFVLAAWRKRDELSEEAGMKYLISGALASAFMIYGLGLIYGVTGVMELNQLSGDLATHPMIWVGLALVTAGVGFKVTLVPFHMWAADVYQGAPTLVTAFLSVASKAAGVAVLFHLYFRVFVELLPDWSPMLAVVALITMSLGNLVAIVQENIKRFMAFSSVSQAGYILMGFLGPTQEGVQAILFYLLVYAVSNLAVFGVIILFSSTTGKENIGDFRGFSRTHPLLALIMMLALFSLAGIPPLSGFTGKFFLFSAAAKAGYYWLVVAAAVNSTISLYYYLRIVRQMYIEPVDGVGDKVTMTWVPRFALGLSILATILLGVIPVI